MQKQVDQAYDRMLNELQEIDFVLLELHLYLDTHPDDKQALIQYNQCAQRRRQLAEQFEQKYGPLLPFGHSYSKYPWQWNHTPWPWQV